MELINRPIGETAAKVLAIVSTDHNFVNSTDLETGVKNICINSTLKLSLAIRLELSVKRIEACITELVATHYLERVDQNWYTLEPGLIIEEKSTVVFPSAYVFKKEI